MRTTGLTIAKAKPIIKPVITTRIKAVVSKQKQIGIIQKKIGTKQTTLTKQSRRISQRQRGLLKQKPRTGQRQRLLTKQKQGLRQKQKLLTKQRQALKQRQRLLIKQRQGLRQKHKLLTKQAVTRIRVPIKVIVPRAKIPIGLIKKKKRKKKKEKKIRIKQAYDIFGKHKGKFIRLNRVPLSKARALDRGAFAIDKSTGATFKIKGVGAIKKLGKLTKGERGYFSRTRKKYRAFRIQKGKRITLKNKFIEKKGRPRIDTRGEKRGLSLARFAKRRGFIGRKKISSKPIRRISKPMKPIKRFKRKATPTQLRNLAKGRRILAQMRKR